MPDPQEQQALLTDDGRVYVRTPDGGVASLPQDQVMSFVDSGRGALATPGDIAANEERKRLGEGLGNELQTFGESALSGATVGLSDVAIKMAAPEYAGEMVKRRELNPTSDLLGQGTGLLGSALLTGGSSAVAKGAGVVGAPARGLMGLGAEAGAAVAKTLGKEAATGVLGRAAITGAEYATAGAVEGALFGAAKAATDDFLTDHEITAERIAAGAGNGAVWGGALGGGAGLIGGLAVGGSRKLASLFDRGAAGELSVASKVDDVLHGEASANASARATADLDQSLTMRSGFRSDDEILAELSTGADDVERMTAMQRLRSMGDEASAAKRFESLQQEATRELTAAGNRVAKAADDADAFTNVGLKRDVMRDLFKIDAPADMPATTNRVASTLGEIDDAFAQAIKQPEIFERKGLQAFSQARKEIDTIAGSLKAANSVDDLADIYVGMDRLKRRMGRIQRSAGSGANGDRAAEALVRDGYNRLRDLLEDSTVFGRAATTAQRDINAAWTRYLEFSRAHESLFALKNQTTRSARDGFETIAEMDPSKVGGFLRNLGKAENDVNEKVWLLGSERRADLLETLARHYDVPAEMKAAIASARSDTRLMAQRMRELRTLNETADVYREQLQTVRDLPVVGETLAKIKVNLGKGISFATKTDARAAARAASESGGNASARSAVAHATNGESALSRAGSGVVEWLKKGGQAAGRAVSTASKTVAEAGPLLGVELSARDPSSYERVIRNANALSDPNSGERKTIRVRLSGVREQNPALADAMEAQTQRIGDFLAKKAGELSVKTRPGDPFGQLRKPRHDPGKAAKLAKYIDAAQNPQHALDRIGRGQIRREDIETLREVYPRLYARLVEQVMVQVGDVKKLPSYDARVRLSHLLNTPADPTMRPEYIQLMQQTAASGAQEQAQGAQDGGTLAPSRRRAPEISGIYATRSQDLVGGIK